MTTRRPSAVIWTSHSISPAPPSIALAKEVSVFSGAADELPRWAMTRGGATAADASVPGRPAGGELENARFDEDLEQLGVELPVLGLVVQYGEGPLHRHRFLVRA